MYRHPGLKIDNQDTGDNHLSKRNKTFHTGTVSGIMPAAFANNKNGIFYPVIVQNGEVIGNWHPGKQATFFEDENKVDISRLLSDFHQFMDC